jgi:signal transduction histidine kinase
MKRTPLQDLPLQAKIRTIILIVSGIALLVAFVGLLAFQSLSSWNAIALRYETMAAVIGDQTSAALEFGQPEPAETILASLRAESSIVAAAVFDVRGVPFARYLRPGGTDAFAPPPAAPARSSDRGELLVFRPIESGGERIGTFYLRSDMAQVGQWLRINVVVMVLILLAVAAAIPFLSSKLGQSVSGPVVDLASVVQTVSTQRDYSVRAQKRGNDEIGRLIDGFNDMLTQIQTRDSALEQAKDVLERRVFERTEELEREVSDHREAERQLREKDLLLSEAQQISHLGSWDWELGENRVVYSDEMYRIHGLLRGTMQTTYDDLVRCAHPDDRAALAEVLERGRRSRERFALEYRVLRPDGEMRHVHVQGKVVLDDQGRPERLVGAVQDVTERWRADLEIRKLNQELQLRMAELELSNRELETFSYSVSHDLRAPLRALDGFSEVLLNTRSEKLDEEAQHYLRRIRSASQRMAQLIDGLLDLARISRSQLERSDTNLSTLAADICRELQARDPERTVEIEIEPDLRTSADPRLVQAALGNLLENAWKYTRRRARARIELGALQQEGRIVYFVRDNGAGFDMAYAKKLFGVFQRLHAEREFEGTGIGLATVQRIVQRHGGNIWAEAAVDAGATFFFTLSSSEERRLPA